MPKDFNKLGEKIMYYDFKKIEKDLTSQFDMVNDIRDYNQKKVLKAFINNKVEYIKFLLVAIAVFSPQLIQYLRWAQIYQPPYHACWSGTL